MPATLTAPTLTAPTLTAPTVTATSAAIPAPLSAPAAATEPDPYRDAVLGIDGYANLDYAATAPCLVAAQQAVTGLLPRYASVHRGAGELSRRCTLAYEGAR